MKRLFILASAAALMLASCAKTTVVYNEAPEEISFKQVTNVMTKASLENTVELGVIAYNAGGATTYFANTCFAHDGNYWSADKYWPVSGNLDFILYAPYSETSVSNTSYSSLVISVDNSDPEKEQIDWLYADIRYDGTEKSTSAINVNLKHALAKIIVNLKADTDEVVTIKSFTINDTKQTETLTITQNNTNNTIDWTDSGEEVDWILSGLATGNETLDKSTGKTDNCLVIPSDQTSFTMTYTLEGIVDAEEDPILLTHTHTFDDATWQSGRQYTYNVTVGVTEIKFSCTDSGWTEGNNPIPELEWIANPDNVVEP